MQSRGLAFLCSVSTMLVAGGSARAATGSIQLIDGAGLKYFINDQITFSTSSSASGAAEEASYTQAVAADTLAGGFAASQLNDMFDGYNTLCVSLDGSAGSCKTGNASYIIYNQNGVASLEAAGRQAVFNPQIIGTLQVVRKVYVPENDEFIRWLNVFANTGADPVTFNAIIATNLGSDSNTVMIDTSLATGTASPVTDPTTTWVATMQGFSGATSSDVRSGHVLQGAGAAVPLAVINFVQGDDNPYWVYTITLAAGQTAIMMNINTGAPTAAGVVAKARELALLPGSALQGMTAQELGEVINFDIPCAGQRDQCNDAISDGVGGCLPVPLDDTPCNDGNLCTNVDRCVAGQCQGHPVDCTAVAGACTVGLCDPAVGCITQPADDGTACNDGNPCTDDACVSGACVGTNNDNNACSDNNPCTDDVCSAGACVGTNNDANACDDNNPCTDDACVSGACVGTANDSNACDDHNPCTDDVCVSGACVGTANDSNACDDDNPCTDGDACVAGACVGTPNDSNSCDDHNACTDDACVGGDCIGTPAVGRICDDGNDCSGDDACDASGLCVGTPLNGTPCHDDDPCTYDVCAVATVGGVTVARCVSEIGPANGAACDDLEPCTVDDMCAAGQCGGVPMSCVRLDSSCAVGYCDPAHGACAARPINEGGTCTDNNPCTLDDACVSGQCTGTLKDCSSLNDACHVGACNTDGTCVAEAGNQGGTCDDGNPCTVGDSCANGTCVGSPKDCSALSDACNVGVCGAGGVCAAQAANEGQSCDDGDATTVGDACAAGVCVGHTDGPVVVPPKSDSKSGCGCAGLAPSAALPWLAFVLFGRRFVRRDTRRA